MTNWFAQAVARWRRGRSVHESVDAAAARWIVVDVETSGLDTRRDELLAIGGVAITQGRVSLHDSIELVLQPVQTSPRENILVHGIGEHQQREGTAPEQALRQFLEWAGDAPRVGFHAPFDRAFLRRALRAHLHQRFDQRWLDIAEVAAVLLPTVQAHSLDEWLAHFGIEGELRHNAASDALATAALTLRLLALVKPGQRSFASLLALAGQKRWVRQ